MSNVFHSNSNANIFLTSYNEETNSLSTSGSHRYFTRSTARKLKSPFSIVSEFQPSRKTSPKYNQKWTFDRGDDTSNRIFVKPKSELNVSCDKNIEVVKMRPNSCDAPCVSSNKKLLFKSLQLVLFLGLLSLLICHMIERFGETNASFRFIKEELDDIKTTLEHKIQTSLATMDSKINENHKELQTEMTTLKDLIINKADVDMRSIVSRSLERYDADKTGQVDFALESTGGSIASTRDTITYTSGANTLSLFGIPLCSSSQNARIIIQPSSQPGECWAIAGSTGAVVIQLLGRVIVNGFTLEHIPASISPTGEINTAPKDFAVFGLGKAEDDDGHLLGRYMYDINGPSVQYFSSTNEASFLFVELKIYSNHGHPDYTCIYRFRVHGQLESLT